MVDHSTQRNEEVATVLEICRDIELASAELYEYFAEIFSDHREMAALWNKTAREEKKHALQFFVAMKLRREQIVGNLFVDSSTAGNTLSFVQSIYTMVKESPPTMLEALNVAITLEVNLGKFHMTTVGHFIDDSHKKLFTTMMNSDKKHVEALREFHQRLLSP